MFRPVATLLPLLFCIPSAKCEDSSPVTLDLIVKTLRAREKALTSYEVQGRSFVSDEKGGQVPGSVEREFLYSQTNDGKRELREILIAPDGTRTVGNWIRDDGTKLYTMRCAPKSEHVVEYVVIEETPNQASSAVTVIIPYTNILTPRGKLLSDLVTAGKLVSVAKQNNGEQVVEVKVADRGFEFVVLLSSDHDYLPREVRLTERDRKVVASYRNADGFWFPESGYSDQVNSTGGTLRLAFQIDRILVNAAKTSNDFGMPKLNVGTVIHNRTKSGPRGVFGVPNRDAEKERQAVSDLRDRFGSNSESSKAAKSSNKLEIAARVEPESSNIARVVIILGASVALLVAGIMKLRR